MPHCYGVIGWRSRNAVPDPEFSFFGMWGKDEVIDGSDAMNSSLHLLKNPQSHPSPLLLYLLPLTSPSPSFEPLLSPP